VPRPDSRRSLLPNIVWNRCPGLDRPSTSRNLRSRQKPYGPNKYRSPRPVVHADVLIATVPGTAVVCRRAAIFWPYPCFPANVGCTQTAEALESRGIGSTDSKARSEQIRRCFESKSSRRNRRRIFRVVPISFGLWGGYLLDGKVRKFFSSAVEIAQPSERMDDMMDFLSIYTPPNRNRMLVVPRFSLQASQWSTGGVNW
jgi:hypothetical protein